MENIPAEVVDPAELKKQKIEWILDQNVADIAEAGVSDQKVNIDYVPMNIDKVSADANFAKEIGKKEFPDYDIVVVQQLLETMQNLYH